MGSVQSINQSINLYPVSLVYCITPLRELIGSRDRPRGWNGRRSEVEANQGRLVGAYVGNPVRTAGAGITVYVYIGKGNGGSLGLETQFSLEGDRSRTAVQR